MLAEKLIAANSGLLSVCRWLARHSVHAADIDFDSEFDLRIEANPHRLTLCLRVN